MNSHFSMRLFQKNTCIRGRGAIALRRLRALLLCLGLCAIVAGLPAQAQSAPAAPTNYAVAASTGVATWTKSSGASNYDLELRPGDATDLDDHGDAVTLRPGDVATVDFRTAPNARNCCLNGESYHSRIRAVGSNGNSDWTSWSAFTFSGTSSIPEAPTNYAVAASTGVATWTKSSSASNYDLELRPGDASDLDDHGDAVALLPGDVATVGFRTAPNARNCCLNGESYHSRIRAVGSNGFSPWTSWSAFTFSGTSSIPNTPTGLSVASETGIASWSAPTGATGYDLELQVGTDGTTTTLMTGNFVEEDLTSATNCCVDQESYRTRIRATGANGFSPWSTWTTFVFGGTSSIADSPPGQRDTGDRDSGGSSGSRRQSEAKPTPKPGVDHLPYPTQDHSRLPVGAVVKSDSPWIQFREIKVAYLGYQSVIDAGARAAIDVWSPLRLEAEVCLEGTGSLLFLDASTSPRARRRWSLTRAPARLAPKLIAQARLC